MYLNLEYGFQGLLEYLTVKGVKTHLAKSVSTKKRKEIEISNMYKLFLHLLDNDSWKYHKCQQWTEKDHL